MDFHLTLLSCWFLGRVLCLPIKKQTNKFVIALSVLEGVSKYQLLINKVNLGTCVVGCRIMHTVLSAIGHGYSTLSHRSCILHSQPPVMHSQYPRNAHHTRESCVFMRALCSYVCSAWVPYYKSVLIIFFSESN